MQIYTVVYKQQSLGIALLSKKTVYYHLSVTFCSSFDRQHLSYDGKREDYQNCSVLYCVLKLNIVISTLR